ncbi:MAG TPA: IS5/IS1182 family transposase, partial [Planctomycetota bacterium]|nr:IS5/IS1182 family transposase [Planctomycetota bacterium]
MVSMRSRAHRNHKTRCRLRNWAAYDQALAARGDTTIWLSPEAVAGWKSKPSGRR